VTIVLVALGFITACLGLAATVLGLLNQRRIARAAAEAGETAREVQNISVQVDGRLSTLLERQAQLLGAMHESGVPIPPRPAEPQPAADPAG
jgi:hypothetical protein